MNNVPGFEDLFKAALSSSLRGKNPFLKVVYLDPRENSLDQEESEMSCCCDEDLEMTETEALDSIMMMLGEMSQSARLRTMSYLNSWNQELLAEEDQEVMKNHYLQHTKVNVSSIIDSALNGGSLGAVRPAPDAATEIK